MISFSALPGTSEAVSDAGIGLQDVDDLVLVGGQTRMPLIRQRVSTLLQREPVYGVNPEEVVATGAMFHGLAWCQNDQCSYIDGCDALIWCIVVWFCALSHGIHMFHHGDKVIFNRACRSRVRIVVDRANPYASENEFSVSL